MNQININNEFLLNTFLTPDEIKKAKELEENEKYWMRIDHVRGDVESSHEMNEDLGDEE